MLVARIETQLLAERTAVRGWYAELAPDADSTPYRHVGCRELAVDYRRPDSAAPMRLLFKPSGRGYGPPRLTWPDFRTDLAEIMSVVYGITDPDVGPADCPDLVPLR